MRTVTIRTAELPPPAKYMLELTEGEMLALAVALYWHEPSGGKQLWAALPEEVKAAAASVPKCDAETAMRQRSLPTTTQQRVTRLLRGLSSRPSVPEMDDTEREYGLK